HLLIVFMVIIILCRIEKIDLISAYPIVFFTCAQAPVFVIGLIPWYIGQGLIKCISGIVSSVDVLPRKPGNHLKAIGELVINIYASAKSLVTGGSKSAFFVIIITGN